MDLSPPLPVLSRAPRLPGCSEDRQGVSAGGGGRRSQHTAVQHATPMPCLASVLNSLSGHLSSGLSIRTQARRGTWMFQEHGVLRAGGGAGLGMGWGGGASSSSGRAARGLRDAGVRSPGSGRSGKHKPCGAEGEIVSVTITLVTRAMLATRAPAEAARRCIVVDSSPHPGHRPVAAEGPAAGAEAALESARKGTKQPRFAEASAKPSPPGVRPQNGPRRPSGTAALWP